jgi:hypothetical protein
MAASKGNFGTKCLLFAISRMLEMKWALKVIDSNILIL